MGSREETWFRKLSPNCLSSYPPHPSEPLWFRLDGFSIKSFACVIGTTGNLSQKLLREIVETGGTRLPDMVCPVSLNSGSSRTWIWTWIHLLPLLPAVSSPTLPIPQHHWGALNLPLSMLLLGCPPSLHSSSKHLCVVHPKRTEREEWATATGCNH